MPTLQPSRARAPAGPRGQQESAEAKRQMKNEHVKGSRGCFLFFRPFFSFIFLFCFVLFSSVGYK